MNYYKVRFTYDNRKRIFVVSAYHKLQARQNLINDQGLDESKIKEMEVILL